MIFSFYMEMMGSKGSALIFLLFTSLFLTTSFAGGQMRHFSNLATQVRSKGEVTKWMKQDDKALKMHRRILRVHTNDYENYDSPPSFSKPSFKMIPN